MSIGTQWLLVPAGIVLCDVTRNETTRTVFEARRSVLVAFRSTALASETWVFIANDRNQYCAAAVADDSIPTLLAGWCATVGPPTAEQLSDFVDH